MNWHQGSWDCPCAACQASREVCWRIALVTLGVVMIYALVLAWPAQLFNALASGGQNRRSLPDAARGPAGAEKSGSFVMARVAPSVENVRIGAPPFVSTWRWQLRASQHVLTPPVRWRALRPPAPRRPWCARWSDNR